MVVLLVWWSPLCDGKCGAITDGRRQTAESEQQHDARISMRVLLLLIPKPIEEEAEGVGEATQTPNGRPFRRASRMPTNRWVITHTFQRKATNRSEQRLAAHSTKDT